MGRSKRCNPTSSKELMGGDSEITTLNNYFFGNTVYIYIIPGGGVVGSARPIATLRINRVIQKTNWIIFFKFTFFNDFRDKFVTLP